MNKNYWGKDELAYRDGFAKTTLVRCTPRVGRPSRCKNPKARDAEILRLAVARTRHADIADRFSICVGHVRRILKKMREARDA